MRKVSACIVDSGIMLSHKRINCENIKEVYIIDEEKSCCMAKKCDCDDLGHGTAVTYLISSKECDISIFKVFNKDYECDCKNLLLVLKYIYDYVDCDIINLSLGSLADSCELYDICLKLHKKGIIIVAAFDNYGQVSFPAFYPFVIGVDSHSHCRKATEYIFVKNNQHVNLFAHGNMQRLPWVKPEYAIVNGASYAAAHVTGIIIDILSQKRATNDNILEYLETHAPKFLMCKNASFLTDQCSLCIENAIVFPYTKEIDCIMNNTDLLSFPITGVYSHRLLGNLHKNVSRDINKEFIVQDYESIDWENDNFDTVIIGHLHELESFLSEQIIDNMIQKCVRYKKNIYSFDNIEQYKEMYEKEIDVYCPPILNDFNNNLFGRRHQIKTPVLGIFGTSSRQGKFSLQLELRRRFLREGYSVGQLGTEPSSYLFGFDEMYAYGYGSDIYLNSRESIDYVDSLMSNIDSHNHDIIIAGAQSGTLPYSLNHGINLTVETYLFLLAAKPDKIILNVNPYDEIDYIKRTISVIEATIDDEVIAVVLFPVGAESVTMKIIGKNAFLDSVQAKESKDHFEKALGKPCYILGDEIDMANLFDDVVAAFSKE